MKKASKTKNDDLRPEYPPGFFKNGERGKYAARYRQGTNLVLLEPDIAAAFSTPKAVNQALRLVLELAKTAKAK
jgi:hypothetical protein